MNAWIHTTYTHRPLQLEDLTPPEQFMVWALRTQIKAVWSAKPWDHHEQLQEALFGVLGIVHVETGLGNLEKLIHILKDHTRRVLHFHNTDCAPITMDEWRLLALIAAHQEKHYTYAAALTRWLVPSCAAIDFSNAAVSLADVMKEKDMLFPVRVNFAEATAGYSSETQSWSPSEESTPTLQ